LGGVVDAAGIVDCREHTIPQQETVEAVADASIDTEISPRAFIARTPVWARGKSRVTAPSAPVQMYP